MIALVAIPVVAVPTTLPVTGLTNQQVTFNANGGSTTGWFMWGYGTNFYWTTPNQTVSGSFSDNQFSAPMLTSTSYNVKACDVTGCGNAVAFAVPKATMLPQTHYGTATMTVWRSGFNITQVAGIILTPYSGTMATPVGGMDNANSIIWGMLFFFIFAGYWLRGNGVVMPSIMAIISGAALFGSAAMNPLGISPIFMSAGIPLLIVGIAGIAFTWFTK